MCIHFSSELTTAVRSYARRNHRTISGVVCEAMEIYLIERGLLPRLRQPEDFAEGEDQRIYPWTYRSVNARAAKLVWWSRDPEVKTWARLFRDIARQEARSVASICREYGVLPDTLHRVYSRYDRWRRGDEARPAYDPLAAIKATGAKTKKARKTKKK